MMRRRIRAAVCCLLACLLLLSGCGQEIRDSVDHAENSTSILEADPESLDDITMEGLVSEVLGEDDAGTEDRTAIHCQYRFS